ncbi:phosphopantetheinyl transferase [Klebsiella pneumoniae]|uniref:Phosphopantetheinyl transferase n=1 Tax=Klebsiella pneumoniae TaxID=573 RepID=A0A377XLC8_KLEPN|nr:phosphopantetheinyl transferase [Klebsiella pneumoniae]
MATHFARGILSTGEPLSTRLSAACHQSARLLPTYRQARFCASRSLLAELLFMLYGISELPEIINEANGRPVFSDRQLPRFSIAYTGNIVGVALTTEGDCGLDMELQRTVRSHDADRHNFSNNENLWITYSMIRTKPRSQLVSAAPQRAKADRRKHQRSCSCCPALAACAPPAVSQSKQYVTPNRCWYGPLPQPRTSAR